MCYTLSAIPLCQLAQREKGKSFSVTIELKESFSLNALKFQEGVDIGPAKGLNSTNMRQTTDTIWTWIVWFLWVSSNLNDYCWRDWNMHFQQMAVLVCKTGAKTLKGSSQRLSQKIDDWFSMVDNQSLDFIILQEMTEMLFALNSSKSCLGNFRTIVCVCPRVCMLKAP